MDKWGRRFFTAGAVWLIFMGLVHSLSLFGTQVPKNDTERQLQDLVSNYKFNVLGSMRSTDDFLRGFSISFLLAGLVTGTLDLALRRERPGLLKRIALVNAIWLALMLAVGLRYFFIIPNSFIGVGLVLFVAAWLKLPSESAG